MLLLSHRPHAEWALLVVPVSFCSYVCIAVAVHKSLREISHTFLGLPLRPSIANLLKPLQTQRPEVEVRIAKAFLTPENIWSFAHAQQHTQFFT